MSTSVSGVSQKVRGEALPLERLAANHSIPEKDKIAEATCQFESLLVRQMLTELRPKAAQASVATDIYWGLISERLAESISRSGAIGLAAQLQEGLVPAENPSTSEGTHANRQDVR